MEWGFDSPFAHVRISRVIGFPVARDFCFSNAFRTILGSGLPPNGPIGHRVLLGSLVLVVVPGQSLV